MGQTTGGKTPLSAAEGPPSVRSHRHPWPPSRSPPSGPCVRVVDRERVGGGGRGKEEPDMCQLPTSVFFASSLRLLLQRPYSRFVHVRSLCVFV